MNPDVTTIKFAELVAIERALKSQAVALSQLDGLLVDVEPVTATASALEKITALKSAAMMGATFPVSFEL